jgi:diguanylate cyclase (GGDEF)-like protein
MTIMIEQPTSQTFSVVNPPQDEPKAGTAPQSRVLIADDDPYIRQMLELALCEDGYDVICASDGSELVRMAQERGPNLILVDLSMPRMDGYEAIRQLRNDTRTAHIPMMILTARSGIQDIVIGFDTGADDYLAKPFDIDELLARVRSHLRRSNQRPVLNPLSGLPGGVLLSQELRHRLAREAPSALLYADLDNFKAFNDIYGFSRGDQAILFVARLLQQTIAEHGNADDFIGHIGGDDFAILTTPDRIDQLCGALIAAFDTGIGQLYNADDRRRGYISAADRYGILRRFGLMTISIGVVTTERRRFEDEEALTRVAADMKHFAKEQGGSTYAVDQRGPMHGAGVERRAGRKRSILVVSEDTSLRLILRSTLRDHEYTVYEAADLAAARWILAAKQPAVLLADGQLGVQLDRLWAEQEKEQPYSALVLLVDEDGESQPSGGAGVAARLRLPLPLAEIVGCIERLLRSNSASDDGPRIYSRT